MERIFEITPHDIEISQRCINNNTVPGELYGEYNVKRGLRDINGNGVLSGLTNISEVNAKVDGVPCPGELYYRGYDIKELVKSLSEEKRCGFEEIAYLLIIGDLPNKSQLDSFTAELAQRRTLPQNFTRDVIMKAPSENMMITLAKSLLTLYSYDPDPDNTAIPNVMRQCLNLISQFPMLAVYSYNAYSHSMGNSLYIHQPDPNMGTAENILRMLRPDKQFTELEALVLDMALILHMEHGGGNNSSFTTRVVTSSGTDTYSVMAAALASLKGPRHGGANIKVVQMFDELKSCVKDWKDEEAIENYLCRLLHREALDRQGLIYGIGHAVYSVSDPRAQVLRAFVGKLAAAKGREEEFELYSTVERLAPTLIGRERKIYKGVNANVDFYSGFVYSMLGLPMELYTPMFAVARIVGWSAHRLEEIVSAEKIIRPAYKAVAPRRKYVPLNNRQEEAK